MRHSFLIGMMLAACCLCWSPGAPLTSTSEAAATRPAARTSHELVAELAAKARRRAELARATGDAEGVRRAHRLLRRLGEATRAESLEIITASLALGDAATARSAIVEMKGHELAPLIAKAMEGACVEVEGDAAERDRLWGECLQAMKGSETALHLAMRHLDAVCGSLSGAKRFGEAVLTCPPENSSRDAYVLMRMLNRARNYERYDDAARAVRGLTKLLDETLARGEVRRVAANADLYERLDRALKAGDAETLLAIAKDARDEDIVLAVGRWLRLAGRGAEAERVIQPLVEKLSARIKAEPNGASTHNTLAWLYARTRTRLPEALRLAAEAVRLSPESGAYLDTLAEVQFALGRPRDALATEMKAVLRPEESMKSFFFEQIRRFKAAAK